MELSGKSRVHLFCHTIWVIKSQELENLSNHFKLSFLTLKTERIPPSQGVPKALLNSVFGAKKSVSFPRVSRVQRLGFNPPLSTS